MLLHIERTVSDEGLSKCIVTDTDYQVGIENRYGLEKLLSLLITNTTDTQRSSSSEKMQIIYENVDKS